MEADRQLARNASDYLSRRGCRVEIHSGPQQAVSAADKQKPDVIVLDLSLAGRSGVEFLYELRSYPDWQRIPVIAAGRLTPEELEAYQPALAQLGISAYLPKRFTPLSMLADEIRRLAAAPSPA